MNFHDLVLHAQGCLSMVKEPRIPDHKNLPVYENFEREIMYYYAYI